MKKAKYPIITFLTVLLITSFASNSYPWHDETHIAIAKATGYKKWYNTTGADMAKLKAGRKEKLNHYVNNPRETIITSEMVFQQIDKYNKTTDIKGHLYGAIIASVRDYLKENQKGKYGEYHLAFCCLMSVICLNLFIIRYIIHTIVKIIKLQMA